jgi:hypothetical protein
VFTALADDHRVPGGKLGGVCRRRRRDAGLSAAVDWGVACAFAIVVEPALASSTCTVVALPPVPSVSAVTWSVACGLAARSITLSEACLPLPTRTK